MNIPGLDQSTSDVVTALIGLGDKPLLPMSVPLGNGEFMKADVLTDKGLVPFLIPVEIDDAGVRPRCRIFPFEVIQNCTVTGFRLWFSGTRWENLAGHYRDLRFTQQKKLFVGDLMNINTEETFLAFR